MPKAKKNKAVEPKEARAVFEPVITSLASDADYPTTRSRRNISAITERSYKYKNIEDGFTPFRYEKHNYGGVETCSVYEAVILCQKAYYNVGTLRNIIDLMVDFSSTDVYLKGSTAKIRKFYQAWFNKIALKKLESQFFREHYRSGNTFIYPYKAKLKESDLRNLTKLYSNTSSASATIPIEYVILNPADIQTTGSFSVGTSRIYYKRLSDYELECLRNPRTEQDKQVYESLPEDIKKQIQTNVAQVLLPLSIKDIVAVFYNKQAYEPFSVPLLFSVLEDVSLKMELKKMDAAMLRVSQQCILLVTMGTEEGGINPDNILAMQKLLESQTVGRSIVSDFSTKAQFVIPDISSIIDPKKYEVIDRDINTALNNILIGDAKFANQKNKVDVFIARLEQGRQVFLNEFLIPEMVKIADEMGFESVPTPYFDSITLSDDANKMRVYSRLIELGILTPNQGIEAIETGRLPNKLEMEEAQKEYKEQRDKLMFEPLVGGSNRGETGRPAGTTGIPQSTKKVGQIGSGEEMKFEMTKIAQNMILANKVDVAIKKKLKSKFKLKELSEDQESLVPEIRNLILANENPENWIESVAGYCEKPLDKNKVRVSEVQDLAIRHQVDSHMAGILFASKK